MQIFFSVLVVLIPFFLQGLVLKIPAEAEIQRALFIACPVIGLIVSAAFAFARRRRSWFYAIIGVLYGIQLFFSVAVLNWKQT